MNGALVAEEFVVMLVIMALIGPAAELCAWICRAGFRRRARR